MSNVLTSGESSSELPPRDDAHGGLGSDRIQKTHFTSYTDEGPRPEVVCIMASNIEIRNS